MLFSFCSASKLCDSSKRGNTGKTFIEHEDMREENAHVQRLESRESTTSRSSKPNFALQTGYNGRVPVTTSVLDNMSSVSGDVSVRDSPKSQKLESDVEEPSPISVRATGKKIMALKPRSPEEVTQELNFGNTKKMDPEAYARHKSQSQSFSAEVKREIQLHQTYSSERTGRRERERNVENDHFSVNQGSAYTGSKTYKTTGTTGSLINKEDWNTTAITMDARGQLSYKDDQPLTKIGHEDRFDQRPLNF